MYIADHRRHKFAQQLYCFTGKSVSENFSDHSHSGAFTQNPMLTTLSRHSRRQKLPLRLGRYVAVHCQYMAAHMATSGSTMAAAGKHMAPPGSNLSQHGQHPKVRRTALMIK